MKFIPFPEMTHKVPTLFDGEEICYFSDGQGNIVICAEIDKDDLKVIRDNGKVYIMLMGAFKVPPPMGVSATNPFKDYENKDKKSPGDDQQPDPGDNKLSIS